MFITLPSAQDPEEMTLTLLSRTGSVRDRGRSGRGKGGAVLVRKIPWEGIWSMTEAPSSQSSWPYLLRQLCFAS